MADVQTFNIVPDNDDEEFLVDFGEVQRVGGGGTDDFNSLQNRPKYNSQAMTGNTNIPEVPLKVSQLANDAGYQTENEVALAVGAEKTLREEADTTLQGNIDAKQDKLTAGSNITISNGTISATDTTYSDFTGTSGTAAGTSGLVPAPATTDTDKFLKSDGTWATAGGGGGSVTPVQTTGTSTNDVMSQDATTKMIYPDIANKPYKMVIGEGYINSNKGVVINGKLENNALDGIAIGCMDGSPAQIGTSGRANYSIAIGKDSAASRGDSSVVIGNLSICNSGQNTGNNVAIGYNSYAGNASETSTVALGAYARTTRTGEVNVGTGGNNRGYNSTDYRVIGGVHDGQLAQDAVTVAQVNATIDAINTALSVNIPHIGASS